LWVIALAAGEKTEKGLCHRRQVFAARMHRAPGAPQRKSFHVELDQIAGGEFGRAAFARQHRDAEPGAHTLLDGLQRTQLLHALQSHRLFVAVRLERAPRARSRLAQQYGLLDQPQQ